MRSSSVSVSARGNGSGVDVDLRLVSLGPLLALVAALVSNWNKSATAMNKKKRRFSK
jgi:hypothetical protein